MKMYAVFQETCYLHRMKPNEVLDYEVFLANRIVKIEEVVTKLFQLLDDVFIAHKQEQFEKKMIATKGHGINMKNDVIYKMRQIHDQEMEEFVKKLRDDQAYPIKKKLQYLIRYQAELIEADKNRKENRFLYYEISKFF